MEQRGSILQRARRQSPAACAATAVITMLFAIKGQKLQIIVGAAVWYALWGFFFFMAFAASVYLLLRAPFRPGRLSPPASGSP